MTDGILAPDALAALSPDKVSPGLIALVGDEAPTRAILCAGAGHFAAANITLTQGKFLGEGPDVADAIVAAWPAITERTNELVPAAGLTQSQREFQAFKSTQTTTALS
jgi:hypothetical protein